MSNETDRRRVRERLQSLFALADGSDDGGDPLDDAESARSIRQKVAGEGGLLARAVEDYAAAYGLEDGELPETFDIDAFVSVRGELRLRLAFDADYELPPGRAAWYARFRRVYVLGERAGQLADEPTLLQPDEAVAQLRQLAGQDVGTLRDAQSYLGAGESNAAQVVGSMLLDAAAGGLTTAEDITRWCEAHSHRS